MRVISPVTGVSPKAASAEAARPEIFRLDNPEIREAAGGFLTALVEHYRSHPALLGYDLWNENTYNGGSPNRIWMLKSPRRTPNSSRRGPAWPVIDKRLEAGQAVWEKNAFTHRPHTGRNGKSPYASGYSNGVSPLPHSGLALQAPRDITMAGIHQAAKGFTIKTLFRPVCLHFGVEQQAVTLSVPRHGGQNVPETWVTLFPPRGGRKWGCHGRNEL